MPGKLFTIALPVRNGGPYLRLCVESILGQRCGDFELAILDNASTDGSTEWLRSLRDPRVRLHPSAQPLSIEENWARIKDIPKQEFLTTIGHDDLLDPGFLEVIAALIRAQPDAGLYGTHFRLIDADGAVVRRCRPVPERETAAGFLAARLWRLRDSFGTGHVFRSAAYEAVGGIPPFPKLLYADDALFLRLIGSAGRATALEESFSYRLHFGSTSGHAGMRDEWTALEVYAGLLGELRAGDPAIRLVLARDFAHYAFGVGRNWLRQECEIACRERRPLDPQIRPRITALAGAFGAVPPRSPLDDPRTRLMEKAAASPVLRGLYLGAAAAEGSGQAVRRKLLDLARSAAGRRSAPLA